MSENCCHCYQKNLMNSFWLSFLRNRPLRNQSLRKNPVCVRSPASSMASADRYMSWTLRSCTNSGTDLHKAVPKASEVSSNPIALLSKLSGTSFRCRIIPKIIIAYLKGHFKTFWYKKRRKCFPPFYLFVKFFSCLSASCPKQPRSV